MNRMARAETALAIGAAALALIAAAYFAVSLMGAHQVCYGIHANKLHCEGVTLVVAERLLLVVATLLALFGGASVGAWFHLRARDAGARSASFGLLCSCTVFLVLMVVSAISGVGFFLVPSTLLIVLAALAGTWNAVHPEGALAPSALAALGE